MRDGGAACHRGRTGDGPGGPAAAASSGASGTRRAAEPVGQAEPVEGQPPQEPLEAADRAPGPDAPRATAGAPAVFPVPWTVRSEPHIATDRSHAPRIDADGEYAGRLRRQPDRRIGNGRRDSARGSCERNRTIRGCCPHLFSRKRVAFDSAWVERQPPHVPRLHRASSGRWCSRHRGHHHGWAESRRSQCESASATSLCSMPCQASPARQRRESMRPSQSRACSSAVRSAPIASRPSIATGAVGIQRG